MGLGLLVPWRETPTLIAFLFIPPDPSTTPGVWVSLWFIFYKFRYRTYFLVVFWSFSSIVAT